MSGHKSIPEVQRQIDILVRACDGLKFDEIIRRMILDGKLSEVEFYCPTSKNSAKSFILPGGVAIRLNTKEYKG